MPLRFQCPGCKLAITVDDSQAGTTVNCPTCRAKLKIPVPPNSSTVGRDANASSRSSPSESSQPTKTGSTIPANRPSSTNSATAPVGPSQLNPSKPKSPNRPTASSQHSNVLRDDDPNQAKIACGGCGKVLKVDRAMAGKKGVCPKCKTVFLVPELGGSHSMPGGSRGQRNTNPTVPVDEFTEDLSLGHDAAFQGTASGGPYGSNPDPLGFNGPPTTSDDPFALDPLSAPLPSSPPAFVQPGLPSYAAVPPYSGTPAPSAYASPMSVSRPRGNVPHRTGAGNQFQIIVLKVTAIFFLITGGLQALLVVFSIIMFGIGMSLMAQLSFVDGSLFHSTNVSTVLNETGELFQGTGLAQFRRAPMSGSPTDGALAAGLVVLLAIFAFLVGQSFVLCTGGYHMLFVRQRGWCLAACIVALIPCHCFGVFSGTILTVLWSLPFLLQYPLAIASLICMFSQTASQQFAIGDQAYEH